MSPPSFCLFGAAPDTGNLGVSALCYGTATALLERLPDATLTVFDHGTGVREFTQLGSDRARLCGARHTNRLHKREAYWNIRLSARLGGLGSPAAERLLGADACLDISGGDSFADLYGPWRFRAVALPKLIAIENRIPLVLLPQTYGPFGSAEARRTAARIVRASAMAWARDERSFATLRDLAGDAFDPAHHRAGVDVAFLLPVRRPDVGAFPPPLPAWLESADPSTPLAGVNVSGLIYGDPQGARERFGFIADYRELVRALVNGLVHCGARVALVPHVVTPPGTPESDLDASEQLVRSLEPAARERVAIVPALADPREVKWVIGRCEWFCGTRMHSTIAGLSQGVPTSSIAYSLKTAGVFETCAQGGHVVDPRLQEGASMLEVLLRSFARRSETRDHLAARLPGVLDLAREQMGVIADQAGRPTRARAVRAGA